jgi:hypothetical protein
MSVVVAVSCRYCVGRQTDMMGMGMHPMYCDVNSMPMHPPRNYYARGWLVLLERTAVCTTRTERGLPCYAMLCDAIVCTVALARAWTSMWMWRAQKKRYRQVM